MDEILDFLILIHGSGALNGKMISEALLEISLWGVFFLFLAPAGGPNPTTPYPHPFPNPIGLS